MNPTQTDARSASIDSCIFCKIVKGELSSKKVYEDSDVLAFLDINPATLGHSLVISKKHYANIYDINEDDLGKVVNVAKILAERMKNRLRADGVNIFQSNGRIAGQEIEHVHFHVVPRYTGDSIMIKFPRVQLSEEEMKNVQEKLKEESTAESDRPRWI